MWNSLSYSGVHISQSVSTVLISLLHTGKSILYSHLAIVQGSAFRMVPLEVAKIKKSFSVKNSSL